MKKVIICALLLCVILSGCAQAIPENNITTTVLQMHTSTTMVQSTTTEQSTANSGNGSSGSSMVRPFYTTYVYDEYRDFITQRQLPAEFVTYEQIPNFGEFHEARYWHDPALKVTNYYYMVTTPAGHVLAVEIHPLSVLDDPFKVYPLEVDLGENYTGSLHAVGSGEGGYIRKGNIMYVYKRGTLMLVQWTYKGNRFKISSWDDDYDLLGMIPLGEQPGFIRDLLHTDTVGRAMQTFVAAMESAAVK